MTIDLECVRDVLLTIERLALFDSSLSYKPLSVKDIHEELPDYQIHIVYYTLLKLEEAGYIYTLNGNPKNISLPHNIQALTVLDLTFSGSEYLNAVRDQTVWGELKPFAKSLTLEGIKAAAIKLVLGALPF